MRVYLSPFFFKPSVGANNRRFSLYICFCNP
nr:MAG TPA: hypothetical protein [Caudoviricetes sp.]